MVRGAVIENRRWFMMAGELGFPVRRLWVIDGYREVAVYSDSTLAHLVREGDSVWWDATRIYWTHRSSSGRTRCISLSRVGRVHDPRGSTILKLV